MNELKIFCLNEGCGSGGALEPEGECEYVILSCKLSCHCLVNCHCLVISYLELIMIYFYFKVM